MQDFVHQQYDVCLQFPFHFRELHRNLRLHLFRWRLFSCCFALSKNPCFPYSSNIYIYVYVYIYIDFHVKKYTIQKKKTFPKKCTRHSLKGLPQSSDDLRCWRWRYLPPSEVKMMYMIDTSILYSRYSMSKTYGWIANSLAAWPIWITTRYSSILPTLDVLYHQFYHWNWSSRHSWNSQKKKHLKNCAP